jgi:CheY-like chemotaxis protein
LGEIQEALLNLIYNAIDALPQGGKITLSTDTLEGEVKITVADNGIGMTPEVRERVLEPFFTTKAERGTGLGLSMVYGTMERHRGRVAIESAIGEGTRISLFFPISEGRVEKEISEETINSPSSNILLIDDEEDIVETLTKLLSKSGHHVEGFIDPVKGIECFENQKFDLVFTDLGMSPMTGWNVCNRIKEIHPETPVILVTGWGDDLDEDKMNESGVDKILAKPFDRASILSIIAEVMQRK